MKSLYFVAVLLTIIGSINWGLVGIAHFDLVAYLFGVATDASRVIYTLVGIAGVIVLVKTATCTKKCSKV